MIIVHGNTIMIDFASSFSLSRYSCSILAACNSGLDVQISSESKMAPIHISGLVKSSHKHFQVNITTAGTR